MKARPFSIRFREKFMIYNVNTQTPYRLGELARHNAALSGEQH